MYKLLSVILVVAFAATTSFSQMPHELTEKEKTLIPAYIASMNHRGITNPPVSEVRNPAEWEEMQGVMISWKDHYEFLAQIVKYAKEEARVYIFCPDSGSVKNYLTQSNISLDNISYIQEPTTSVWIRDYAANNIYTNDVDSLLFVDWIYNRARPEDNESPQAVAELLNVPLYENTAPPYEIVGTGGNFFSDGFGTGFSSELILEENGTGNDFGVTPKTEIEIAQIFNDFLGIDRYVLLPTLPYDGIHHIDMHMKLLNEETLLVGEYPAGVADGPQIEENLEYILNNYNSMFGTPYKVVRIPMPPDQDGNYPDGNWWESSDYLTYTNSLIINKTVLVPTYYEEYDTTALRIYREAMPGYRVIGIDANEIIPESGTIHCTTHEIATADPLLISHQEIEDGSAAQETFPVDAVIKHRSGIAQATIYYKIGFDGVYQTAQMTCSDFAGDLWSGIIPGQAAGDSIYYYIHALANSGKEQVRPLPAPVGNFSFRILNNTHYNELIGQKFSLSHLYGNNTEYINLKINAPIDTEASITIYDITGKPIINVFNNQLLEGSTSMNLYIGGLSSGLYFTVLNTNRIRLSEPFVVK